MVFDERHEENNDEDYVDEVSDQLAVWLKTPNARYNDIPEMKLNKLASMKIGSAANCSVACLENSDCDSFDYSYDMKKKSFEDCVLYNVTSKDTELYTGGLSLNVTDHYDLAIKP